MMKRIILLCSFLVIQTLAMTESTPGFEIRVLEDHGSKLVLEFRLKTYENESVDVNGINCSRISLPGAETFLEKGLPELPTIARNIIIPDNALMDYRITQIEYETKKVQAIIPSKGNLYRNIDPKNVPYTFNEFYNSDAWWPEKNVEIHEPFILRDYRGLNIRFNPFQYNSAQHELKVIKRMVVELNEIGKGGANILTKKRNTITHEFSGIYESIFLNFGATRYDSLTERAGRMLIITADAYVDSIQQFVAWKRQKGIDTKIVTISSIGGNIRDSIKACIQREFDAGGLVWVLLVGDGNEVIPALGTLGVASGEDADPVYAYTAGSDYYPDIFISRFSSRSGNPINIAKQVSRSINYEKTPAVGADWYHIGLGVASNEGSPADYTRCDWLKDSLLDYTYTEVKSEYQGLGGSTTGIKNDIEAGLSIINYIGHGYTGGWGSVSFGTNDLNNLNNPWMLPFVISVACVVGDFNGPDCFCEVSVTAGSKDTADGFLVHWGSTINQSWVPPCYGQEGAVNLLTHDKSNTAGGIFFNGACYMIEKQGSAGIEMAQTWVIFGDASVQLRTDTPESLTVSHASSINVGQNIFDVNVVGVENALVGLVVDSILIGSGYTDSLGNVTITLNPPPADSGVMNITVTAYNKIPYIGAITILGIEETSANSLSPTENGLTVLYPNPSQNQMVIRYQLADKTTDASIRIYDVDGRLVKQFNNLPIQPLNQLFWNGKDDHYRVVPSGIYFVELIAQPIDKANHGKKVVKVLLLQ